MPEDRALLPTNRDNSDPHPSASLNASTSKDVWHAGVRRVNRLVLVDPRSSLARSSPVAVTVSLRQPSYLPPASHHVGYNYVCKNYSVEDNVITILASDGAQHRQPTPRPLIRDGQENEKINELRRLKVNDEAAVDWRKKVAWFLGRAALSGKRLDNEPLWRLANFPPNYTLYVHRNGYASDERNARTDYYLYGSQYVKAFRSPAEFALHGKWLMDGWPLKANGRPDCGCCYCSKRPQKAITEELNGDSRPEQDTQPSGPQRRQSRRTRHPKISDPPVMAKDYRVNPTPPMQ